MHAAFSTDSRNAHIYAIVEAVQEMSKSSRQYVSVALDGIDAEWFDEINPQTRREKVPPSDCLGVLRVMTTSRKHHEMIGDDIREGQWVIVEIGKSENSPRVWAFASTNDYESVRRFSLLSIGLLPSAPTGQSAGGALGPIATAGARLRRNFDLRNLKRPNVSQAKRLLKQLHRPTKCIAHDVGQANCCELLNCFGPKVPRVSAFVDIGEPLPFHRRTYNQNLQRMISKAGLVVLTHWDWDHISAGRHNRRQGRLFNQAKWIVPLQIIGPNAFYNVAVPNRRNLVLLSNQNHIIRSGCVDLHFGNGVGEDRNNTGIGVVVSLVSKARVLLPGDARLGRGGLEIRAAMKHVVVPHHGGSGCGVPNRQPRNRTNAVMSVGYPNYYNHPNLATSGAYHAAGWAIFHTDTRCPQRGHRGLVTFV